MKTFPINEKLHEKILQNAKKSSFKVSEMLFKNECSLDEVIGSFLSARIGPNEVFENLRDLYVAISGIVRHSYHQDMEAFYEKIEIAEWSPIQNFVVDEKQVVEISWPTIYIMGRALRESIGLSEEEEKKITQHLDVANCLDEDGWLNFDYKNCLITFFLEKVSKSLDSMPFDLRKSELFTNVSCESNFKMKDEHSFQLILDKNDERGILYANNLLKLLINIHCASAPMSEIENRIDSIILEGQMYSDIIVM